ncbi:hypothetical protein HHK36_022787 [Tetracentron sinense]|uniref:Pentatricopeptide repeat-containing protein n=1 Tax=Tetracentron sinense TaxID=13715 RepID=A0A834YSL2_TETSI|nr:hypothetical protein HHK36_022787 [Tetracentron sinense]
MAFETSGGVGESPGEKGVHDSCESSGRWVFDEMSEKNVITWTSVISGLAQNQFYEDSLSMFLKMPCGSVCPNTLTYLSLLQACSGLQALRGGRGRQIHGLVLKSGSAEELNGVSITVILVGFAQTGLEEKALKLFVKIVKKGIECGGLGESIKVFNRMPMRNSVSWNSMIVAFARHGNGSRALQLYKEMRLEGVEPTDVTFISLLHACSHVGSIVEGFMFLESMAKAHRMSPRMEHYACVVGMVGRDVRCISPHL